MTVAEPGRRERPRPAASSHAAAGRPHRAGTLLSVRKIRRRIRRWLGMPLLATLVLILPAAEAGAWTPAEPTIAPGVRIGTIDVGGLDRATAMRTVLDAYSAPVILTVSGKRMSPAAATLGQQIGIEKAIGRAWAVGRSSTPPPARTEVTLDITVKRSTLKTWISRAAANLRRAPRNATTKLRGRKVRVVRHVYGRELRRARLQADLVAALVQPNAAHDLGSRPDLVRMVKPRVTTSQLPPVLVIDRSARTLTLWSPRRRGSTYQIAVGQPSYPTPLGHWTVVTKQVNPTWTPPDSAWAAGAEPIGPGPDNPLGTRWIGLSVSGVGIHGTPNEGSVGTAASHGCMRMRRRDVEQLFRRVQVGSPVHILA